MSSWQIRRGCSWCHLEHNPKHYGLWSEMLTAECKSDKILLHVYIGSFFSWHIEFQCVL